MTEMDTMLHRIDNQRRSTADFSNIDEFNPIIEKWKKASPQFSEFQDIYKNDDIERDKKEVKRLKKIWESSPDNVKSSEALDAEYLVAEMIYSHNTFGNEVFGVTITNPHDDYRNGIDIIVTFEDEDGYRMHLALDVTVDAGRMFDKVEKLSKDTKEEKLCQPKYFKDGDKYKVEMPKVIIGLDKKQVVGLQEQVVSNPDKLRSDKNNISILRESRDQIYYPLLSVVKKIEKESGGQLHISNSLSSDNVEALDVKNLLKFVYENYEKISDLRNNDMGFINTYYDMLETLFYAEQQKLKEVEKGGLLPNRDFMVATKNMSRFVQ